MNESRCSMDEEMLMWTSYRYCIGRHTYVSSLAPYIGRKYYNLLSDERLAFTANDIRDSIKDALGFRFFEYDWSIRKNRKPLDDFFNWINSNIYHNEDWNGIHSILCYEKDGEIQYDVHRGNCKTPERYEHDYSDLIVWETLASLFDKKNHKYVKVKTTNGEEETILCFETWTKVLVPTKQTNGIMHLYEAVPWKYKKCLKSVNDYLAKGERAGYLNEEYIVSIENV